MACRLYLVQSTARRGVYCFAGDGCDWRRAEKDCNIFHGVHLRDTFHNDLRLTISGAWLKTSGMKVVKRNHSSPDLREAWQHKEHGRSCMFSNKKIMLCISLFRLAFTTRDLMVEVPAKHPEQMCDLPKHVTLFLVSCSKKRNDDTIYSEWPLGRGAVGLTCRQGVGRRHPQAAAHPSQPAPAGFSAGQRPAPCALRLHCPRTPQGCRKAPPLGSPPTPACQSHTPATQGLMVTLLHYCLFVHYLSIEVSAAEKLIALAW